MMNWSLILLGLVAFTGVAFAGNSYLVIIPNLLKVGHENQVSVFIAAASQPVEIKLDLVMGEKHIENKMLCKAGETRNVSLTLPKDFPVGAGILTISGTGGLTFEERHDIIVYDNCHVLLVQTSASTYRPRDTMEIRVVATTENLLPVENGELIVEVYDAALRLVSSFPRVLIRSGLTETLRVPLDEHVLMGSWLVSATLGNTTSSLTVLVSEPVTPSFDLKAIFQRYLLRSDKTLRGVIELSNDQNVPIFGRALIAIGQITEQEVEMKMRHGPKEEQAKTDEWRQWKSQQVQIAGRLELNYDLLSLFNIDVSKALAVQVYIQVTDLLSGQERVIRHVVPIFTRDVIYDIRPLEFEAGVTNEFEIIAKRPDGKPMKMENLIVTIRMLLSDENGKSGEEKTIEVKDFYTRGRNDVGFFNIEIPDNCIGVLMTITPLGEDGKVRGYRTHALPLMPTPRRRDGNGAKLSIELLPSTIAPAHTDVSVPVISSQISTVGRQSNFYVQLLPAKPVDKVERLPMSYVLMTNGRISLTGDFFLQPTKECQTKSPRAVQPEEVKPPTCLFNGTLPIAITRDMVPYSTLLVYTFQPSFGFNVAQLYRFSVAGLFQSSLTLNATVVPFTPKETTINDDALFTQMNVQPIRIPSKVQDKTRVELSFTGVPESTVGLNVFEFDGVLEGLSNEVTKERLLQYLTTYEQVPLISKPVNSQGPVPRPDAEIKGGMKKNEKVRRVLSEKDEEKQIRREKLGAEVRYPVEKMVFGVSSSQSLPVVEGDDIYTTTYMGRLYGDVQTPRSSGHYRRKLDKSVNQYDVTVGDNDYVIATSIPLVFAAGPAPPKPEHQKRDATYDQEKRQMGQFSAGGQQMQDQAMVNGNFQGQQMQDQAMVNGNFQGEQMRNGGFGRASMQSSQQFQQREDTDDQEKRQMEQFSAGGPQMLGGGPGGQPMPGGGAGGQPMVGGGPGGQPMPGGGAGGQPMVGGGPGGQPMPGGGAGGQPMAGGGAGEQQMQSGPEEQKHDADETEEKREIGQSTITPNVQYPDHIVEDKKKPSSGKPKHAKHAHSDEEEHSHENPNSPHGKLGHHHEDEEEHSYEKSMEIKPKHPKRDADGDESSSESDEKSNSPQSKPHKHNHVKSPKDSKAMGPRPSKYGTPAWYEKMHSKLNTISQEAFTFMQSGLTVISDFDSLRIPTDMKRENLTNLFSKFRQQSNVLSGVPSFGVRDEARQLLEEFISQSDLSMVPPPIMLEEKARIGYYGSVFFNTSRIEAQGTGKVVLPRTKPYSTWLATGFALNAKSGLSIAQPIRLPNSKGLYVLAECPKLVQIGERVLLTYGINNYLDKDLRNVVLRIRASPDFDLFELSKPEQTVSVKDKDYTLTIPSLKSSAVEVRNVSFVPKRSGIVQIIVEVESEFGGDYEVLTMYVRESLYERKELLVHLYDLTNETRSYGPIVQTVPQSSSFRGLRLSVSGTGLDRLAKRFTMETNSLVGVDHALVRLYRSLGLRRYLNESLQTESPLFNVTANNITTAYEKLQLYADYNGSYSFVTHEGKQLSSLYLTTLAFGAMISPMMPFRDNVTMNRTLNYILSRQQLDGSFDDNGSCFHYRFCVGKFRRESLTAIVLYSLTRDNASSYMPEFIYNRLFKGENSPMARAQQYLISRLPDVKPCLMTITLFEMAFIQNRSISSELRGRIQEALLSRKLTVVPEDGSKYLKKTSEKMTFDDQLLVNAMTISLYVYFGDYRTASDMSRWVVSQIQIHPQYDTVLDAVFHTEAWLNVDCLFRKTFDVKKFGITVDVTVDNGDKRQFQIDTKNMDVTQIYHVPLPAKQVTYSVKGFGVVAVCMVEKFVEEQPTKSVEPVPFQVSQEFTPLPWMSEIKAKTCLTYSPIARDQQENVNRTVVVEVKLPSGMRVNVRQVGFFLSRVQHVMDFTYEWYGNKLAFFLNVPSSSFGQPICLDWCLERLSSVIGWAPIQIRAYDYSQPETQLVRHIPIQFQPALLGYSFIDAVYQARPPLKSLPSGPKPVKL